MTTTFRIFGAELSPYSVKVRSWFRFKGMAHDWIVRNAENQEEFARHAKLPLVPLVVTPEGEALQDSTPILERLEAEHPEPSMHPTDPVARFVSVLLEEFGDEWGNKWMFHHRWRREVDQRGTAVRIARMMMPTADDPTIAVVAEEVRNRMTARVGFVGSSDQTAEAIEGSYLDAIEILDRHLAARRYLFGARPAFADFALAAQLYAASTDPTAGSFLESRFTNVLGWIQRMHWPRIEGDFEPWTALEPGIAPLLERQVGPLFLPWSVANAAAIAAGEETFTVALAGRPWTQKPQKYHAKSLAALRQKHAALEGREAIDALLERTGCLEPLRG